MKKIMVIFVYILLLPTLVFAGGGGDDTINSDSSGAMSTHSCYYVNDKNNIKNVLEISIYGVSGSAVTPNLEIRYLEVVNTQSANVIFHEEYYGANYVHNYNNDYGTKFTFDGYIKSILSENNSSNETIEKAFENGLFCPDTVYTIYDNVYDKTDIDGYKFMFCDGDTCQNVNNYINNNKSVFSSNSENITVERYSFIKDYSFSNIGQSDPTDTDVEDTYVEIQDDLTNGNDNDKIIAGIANNNIIQQALDQGITEEELINYYIKQTQLGTKPTDCQSLLGNTNNREHPAYYLQFVFDVLKYVAIIILIVFSILDFLGAVSSNDNDAIKKSVNKLIIRMALCVVIFLLPIILEYVFTLIGIYSPSTCGIE